MKKYYLILALLFNAGLNLFAQDLSASFQDNKNVSVIKSGRDSVKFIKSYFLSLNSGYSNMAAKDDILSPLIYSASQMPVELDCLHFGKKNIQFLSIYYSNATLNSSISDSYFQPYTNDTYISLEYAYIRKVNSFLNLNMDLYIGCKLIGELNLMDHFYNSYDDAITGELIFSLGPDILLLKKFGHQNASFLYFNFNMPFIANSPYRFYNYNVGSYSVNNYITLNKLIEFKTKFSYTYFVNKHIGFDCNYIFHYYSLAEYQNLLYSRYMNNQLLIGITVKI